MRNNRHNRRYHESLERRLLLAAQMIKDINQNGASNPADEPVLYALSSSTALFTYDDGVHGDELWKTDGTPTGTQLVKDIVPGGIGSGIGAIEVGENGVGWFVVHDGTTQSQLWRTDGTTTGTVLVKDFSTGGFGPISQLTASAAWSTSQRPTRPTATSCGRATARPRHGAREGHQPRADRIEHCESE
jgi:ELWxxDGT repeat protein